MAQTTTNYGLYKPEATDTYNHLVYDNPNMDTIDAAMKTNADHGVDTATCIKSGTVHSVTRSNASCSVFKFTATGDWNAGDTMNVDGTPVSVFLPDGEAPLDNAYVINTEVIASIQGSRVTLLASNKTSATDSSFDNSNSTLTATNVQGAIDEEDAKVELVAATIQHRRVTGTTNSSGSILIFSNDQRAVMGIQFYSAPAGAWTYRLGVSGTNQFLHLMDENGTAMPNTAVDIEIFFRRDLV